MEEMEEVEEEGFEPRLSSKNPPCRSDGTMLELRRTDTELDQAPGAVGGRTGSTGSTGRCSISTERLRPTPHCGRNVKKRKKEEAERGGDRREPMRRI